MKNTDNHPLPEDLLALLTASGLVSLGVYFFTQTGLLTGGTAGLTLLLTQLTDFSFGQLFFLINLPFYVLAWKQLGRRFTLNTLVAVTVVSACVDNLHRFIHIEQLDPVYAAIMGGTLVGVGMLVLFRHKASLGGFGILALFLQKRFGLRAGKVQMALDCAIVISAFFTVDFWMLTLSVGAAVVCNLVLTLNHKPGRYSQSPLQTDDN